MKEWDTRTDGVHCLMFRFGYLEIEPLGRGNFKLTICSDSSSQASCFYNKKFTGALDKAKRKLILRYEKFLQCERGELVDYL